MKNNTVIKSFLLLITIFGIAWGAFMFVEAREAGFTRIEVHKELKTEVTMMSLSMRLRAIQERLWQLERYYNCMDLQGCRGKMPEPVYFEYRSLSQEMARITQLLGR